MSPLVAGGWSPADQDRAKGKASREAMPRRAQGIFASPERNAVAILEEQHASRLPHLVPVRVGRMLQTPFAFFRGAAAVMASDLSTEATSGHQVVACGDAHLANFGLYASPERRLVFDLNDFDEVFPAPWEWDVKRLTASIWLSGRNSGHSGEQCRTAAEAAARSYRLAIRRLFEGTAAERYYFQVETDALTATMASARVLEKDVKKAKRRTSEQVLAKMTAETQNGEPRIVDQWPLVYHPEAATLDRVSALFELYRSSLRADTAVLVSQYRLVDVALRVVGVGSVGTRCWVVLMLGPSGEPLFLQAKEVQRSVLESHGGAQPTSDVVRLLTNYGQGYRAVAGQRIMQAQSDPFLGWVGNTVESDGQLRDYFVRQFRDMKGSFAVEQLGPGPLADYARLCGGVLARAHSQTPGSAFIAGYLGRSEAFDRAIPRWAKHYADQTEKDHAELERAVRTGRLNAESGV
ncbi:DUF2252 domain-containing protein [Paenarthrobacter sp. AR 02]|uniref:DUF2252 domain-containing protein n=1 Tax=Paenarthrobacter sp. AR 02 TaxID=2899821 RepID=UPI001F3A6F42|nr:DUF2252 domain-containing protein [Paenarthrobacter sp. AR 02]MCF3138789.1 DUF2252 domain-containing protein [Paenarthrobacter sp. AR 02]